MMTEPTPQEPADNTTPAAQLPADKEHHEHIYDVLMKQDEITWRSIILELIKSEQMDPWNINISKLSKMYIKALKKLKEMNLQLSGKVLLAAALLLRIKSSRLVGEDMMEFDRLLASGDESDDIYSDEGFVEGELGNMGMQLGKDQLSLTPKTPQPRKRKVSVYDLIDALAIALNVRRRRILNQISTKTMDVPEKKFDISQLMDDLYNDVAGFLMRDQAEKMAFSNLVPGDSKHDKIHTFIPLLHLTNARKLDLAQHQHFGEIWVSLAKKKEKAKKKTSKAEAGEKNA
ncbi:segregation/condensation protein A [Candidatus Woesearchaeota archaeon]|jgi:segregation and condensation protein A|nr:segregation/condensation protein A [Candidatus Woesearchaeota archaeon]